MQFLGPIWPSDLFFFVPNFQGGHRKFMFQSFRHRCPMVPFGRAYFKFHLLSLDHIVRSRFMASWPQVRWTSRHPLSHAGLYFRRGAEASWKWMGSLMIAVSPLMQSWIQVSLAKEWTPIFRLPTIDSSWLEPGLPWFITVEALNPSSLPLSSMAD